MSSNSPVEVVDHDAFRKMAINCAFVKLSLIAAEGPGFVSDERMYNIFAQLSSCFKIEGGEGGAFEGLKFAEDDSMSVLVTTILIDEDPHNFYGCIIQQETDGRFTQHSALFPTRETYQLWHQH